MNDSPKATAAGALYIVASPIGNLGDITLRALEVLKSVDVVAAEDTRKSGRLLAHYDISKKLLSCHEHNEKERARDLAARLSRGQSVALLTDAGTPSVSDPGYRVLEAAIAEGVRIVPIPGPSAVTAALSAAGLASDAFCFAGFLPQKGARRRARLEQLAERSATLIFYEAPGRVVSLLEEIVDVMGPRRVVVAREMTKRYEEFLRGEAAEVAETLRRRDAVKGEMTILVSGEKTATMVDEADLYEAVEAGLQSGDLPPARLSRELAARFGIPKNRVYAIVLELQSEANRKR
jgi:16S rRNA (cytidine1402-2'-O)-methyltransferase